VLTNGPGDERGRVRRFAPTRKMSSYLVALAIGDFEVGADERVSGVRCRVFSGRGRAAQAAFAAEVTRHVLPWYETYFGQPYPFAKLDQVAVPGFDAGAMENVGAIFYRQNLLLMDPAVTSFRGQKRIAEVIAHEIAHQWFGNLVTMQWWDDLWLNEAFATWIAFKSIDRWRPEWEMWDDYLEFKESALAADALVNTHPVYTPVATPAEATELFDLITYEKGCSVLRMAEEFVGEHAFRAGIQAYMRRYRQRNARGADLWRCLAEASKQPIDSLMSRWVSTAGFPSVDVSLQGRTLTLKQRCFRADPRRQDPETLWPIPMRVRTGAKTQRVILEQPEKQVTVPAGTKWVYPNAGCTGFYRLSFAPETLAALLRHGLKHLSAGERASLLCDQWAQALAGNSGIEQVMDVLSALRSDREPLVNRSAAGIFAILERDIVGGGDRPKLQGLARRFFDPGARPFARVDARRAIGKAAAIDALGDIARDDEMLQSATDAAWRELQDPAALEPHLAAAALRVAALSGDRALLQRYLSTYRARKQQGLSPETQNRILGALPYFESAATQREVHAACIDGRVPQDQLRVVLVPMLGRRASGRGTWRFLQDAWGSIGPRVGAMGIAGLVEATGALPCTLAPHVQEFFAHQQIESAQRALSKALEKMQLRKLHRRMHQRRLGAWLVAQAKRGGASL
jgi:puromycin-sensitive aminopeptidase